MYINLYIYSFFISTNYIATKSPFITTGNAKDHSLVQPKHTYITMGIFNLPSQQHSLHFFLTSISPLQMLPKSKCHPAQN